MNILATVVISIQMGFKKLSFFILLFVVTTFSALAQHDSIGLSTIVSKVAKFSSDHPFEKVYLHFDKPYYAIGDTIWFKAYLTIGPLHQASGLSRIIYVDVITSQDSVVKTLKLPAINGVGFGDITLSEPSFKQGNYHIRAYTNWMRNFGPDYFFNKTIAVGSAAGNAAVPGISFTKTNRGSVATVNAWLLFKDRSGAPYSGKKVNWSVQNQDETVSKGKGITDATGFLTISISGNQLNSSDDARLVTIIDLGDKQYLTNTFSLKAALETADVQFFPEGGDLISGVRSKVAFKAVNTNGAGIDVAGKIVDDAGMEVADLTSQHIGMGIFALTPQPGKTYKAIITFPDGSKKDFDLPRVRADGISLAVNDSDPENLTIKIATNEAFFKNYRNQGYYILAQCGGTVYYTALATLQSQVYTGIVPKSKFPTGILQVTLFAANGEPLSERIVFIQRNDALNLSLHANMEPYLARHHVTLSVTSKSKSLPVEGNFSVAVIDETTVPFDEDTESTILNNLLLTSDLRGYIEKPNYYFRNTDSKTLADLDVLMLTQGYRRFSYTALLADKYPPVTFQPEKGIDITGTIHTSTGLPVNRGAVNLQLPGSHISLNGTTDASGQFGFLNVPVPDSSKVVLRAAASDLMIIVDTPPYQKVAKNYNDPDQITNIDSTLNIYLQHSRKQLENAHVLKEVVIKSTRTTRVVHANYPALTGLSMEADQTLTGEHLNNCSFVLMDCLTSTVFGIRHVDNNFFIKRTYDAGDKRPIQFFVDGRAIDYNFLVNMRTDEIQTIDVYLTDGVSGINNRFDSNGIISITTKNEILASNEKPADLSQLITQGSVVTITPKGYYKARLFYSPKYDSPQSSALQKADLRTTIYWNPNVRTDKNGNVEIGYYNADGKGTYRAVIEGIDNDGNIGRFVLRYLVK